ncbi:MAG TPA: GTPase, partial [Pseudomonadales bacterium]
GKSTLFNRLTEAEVYAADQLFATLDPTLRRLTLDKVGPAVLADTVGFIRHLPHKLVEAFKSTLEETTLADLLLHVVDCASDERDDNMQQVDNVLKEIGADRQPQLLVFNKIDLLGDVQPHIDRDDSGRPLRVWLSARTGAGTELLLQAISERLAQQQWQACLRLPPAQSQLRARLFELKAIQQELFDEQGNALLTVSLPIDQLNQLQKKMAIELQQFIVN